MEERQITVASKTHKLPGLFLVLATQNPIEQEGTYPLPEAQMDRFLLYVNVPYPPAENEAAILRLVRGEKYGKGAASPPQIAQEVVFAARRLLSACHRHDAAAAHTAWIRWRDLQESESGSETSLLAAVLQLQRQLFGHATDAPWTGHDLAREFQASQASAKATNQRSRPPTLPPLNSPKRPVQGK